MLNVRAMVSAPAAGPTMRVIGVPGCGVMTVGERRGLVYALRANGETFAAIGRVLGVTSRRARQIDERARELIHRAAPRVLFYARVSRYRVGPLIRPTILEIVKR